ncbi:hypothetical protein AKJ09_05408 [Labilithrix luteola]|uniref:Uncharacterized protein n=1 Tax=Labilithrix luteola TaxID=1391654 RepID=A0A0K1Q031_9BACT|nr:hypothetical protein [Labilithrix luteola]AKU98744.1 hypothetical protein AKJ09_05408 [Labilithrix luteola]
MKEPERLFSSDADLAGLHALLDRDMPPPGAIARATARVLEEGMSNEAPRATDAARSSPSLTPWLIVGLGGLLVVTGVISRSPWPSTGTNLQQVTTASANPAPVVPAPQAPAGAVVETPPEQTSIRVEDLPTASRTAIAPPPAASADPFLEELALVEKARGALAKGHGRECLEATVGYEKRFAKAGLFREEVAVMHVEALALSGDRATARTLGQRLLADHPNTPYADRIRRVLDHSND